MYSESESVRQTFAYPSPQIASMGCSNNSGKQLNRRGRDRKLSIKDQLYFKLKVLKRVGQLVSNLKSSVALFSHGLNQQQLSYLQNSQQVSQSQCLLREDNILLLLVQSLLWLLLCITLWRCSFELVFEEISGAFEINIITILVYICYLFVYFNSMVRNQRQQLITIRYVIAKKYFKHRFPQLLPFFAGIFAEIIIQPSDQSSFYYILRLIPITIIPQIFVLYKSLENAISSENIGEIFFMFAKLLGKIVIFLHFISLLLNAVRNLQFEMGYTSTWVQRYRPDQRFSSGQLYLLGWYWGTTILCTVGFGDIVPVNNMQRGLVSFLEVFSALIFGYFVNYIGSLIKMQAQKTDMFDINLRKLNRYLSKINIPRALKRQARAHYFDRQEIVKTYNQEEEGQILSNLNNNIKKDILEFSNLQILKTTTLSNFFDLDLLKQIIYKMHKLVYAPQQTIYSPQDKNVRKLWIIEKGKVADKWLSGSGKESKDIAIYTSNAHENVLGWINFIKEEGYKLSAKCQAFSILHQIDREDFFNIIKQNRKNYFKLMELKDQMVLASKRYVCRCICCDSFSHSTVQCPKIHLSRRTAAFLFGRSQYEVLFAKKCKRSKKGRNSIRFKWQQSFENQQLDPNISRVQLIQHQSSNSFALSARNNSKNQIQQIKRPSVDQVIEYVRKCSMRLIQKEDLNTSKRLSSKKDILLPQFLSNKNITKENNVLDEEIMNDFDKMLIEQSQYFEQAHYTKVLQKKSELRTQRRKKKALVVNKA